MQARLNNDKKIHHVNVVLYYLSVVFIIFFVFSVFNSVFVLYYLGTRPHKHAFALAFKYL